MDLLSLTANIIFVTGAAKSALQKLQDLAGIRDGPDHILQLQNEVLIFSLSLQLTEFLGI